MKTFNEMQRAFYKEARAELLGGLAQCTKDQRMIFRHMYAHEHLDWPIEKVVKNMSDDRLDWAMQQVQRTVDDNATAAKNEG